MENRGVCLRMENACAKWAYQNLGSHLRRTRERPRFSDKIMKPFLNESRSEQFVSRILSPFWVAPQRATIIHLGCRLPGTSCGLPGSLGGQPSNAPLFGLAPGGVYRTSRSPGKLVRSYRTFSPLPARTPPVSGDGPAGGMLSVALSFVSPRLHVMEHPALWCSDFPPTSVEAGDRLNYSDRPS